MAVRVNRRILVAGACLAVLLGGVIGGSLATRENRVEHVGGAGRSAIMHGAIHDRAAIMDGRAPAATEPATVEPCVKCDGAMSPPLTDADIAQAGDAAMQAVLDMTAPEPFGAEVWSEPAIGGWGGIPAVNYVGQTSIVPPVYSSRRGPCLCGFGGGGGWFAVPGVPGGHAPAIPEPATWWLMMIGVGAIGVTMRRKPR